MKNLYFTGEIIDIDGDCGGYNLGWGLDKWHNCWKECEIMLRIRQIKLPINHNENDLKLKTNQKTKNKRK